MESLSPYKREVALGILKQIEQAIIRLQERTVNIHSVDDFLLSPAGMEKLDAVCMLLIAIGESLKGFDKVTEKKVLINYPRIPWSNVMGVRDIIAHHYFNIDAEEIFGIVHGELSSLLEAIRYLIQELSCSVITSGTNEVYKDKLNAVEWKKKCEEIKRRDNYRCVNCQNQVLIELDGIDDLEIYLGEIELKNFGIIKNVFQQRENIFNDRTGLTVHEEHELITKEKRSSLDDYGLFLYEMKKNIPCPFAPLEKRVLISTKEIESLGEFVNQLYVVKIPVYYGGKDYKLKSDNIVTLQFNELSDTGNRCFLYRCFAWYYPGSYLGQGILAYNQYSIIFPLYSLDFKQSLDVHHKVYRKKNGQIIEPWEYDDKDLETLCHSCHLKKHKLPIYVINE